MTAVINQESTVTISQATGTVSTAEPAAEWRCPPSYLFMQLLVLLLLFVLLIFFSCHFAEHP